jgi:hypothetical protein
MSDGPEDRTASAEACAILPAGVATVEVPDTRRAYQPALLNRQLTERTWLAKVNHDIRHRKEVIAAMRSVPITPYSDEENALVANAEAMLGSVGSDSTAMPDAQMAMMESLVEDDSPARGPRRSLSPRWPDRSIGDSPRREHAKPSPRGSISPTRPDQPVAESLSASSRRLSMSPKKLSSRDGLALVSRRKSRKAGVLVPTVGMVQTRINQSGQFVGRVQAVIRGAAPAGIFDTHLSPTRLRQEDVIAFLMDFESKILLSTLSPKIDVRYEVGCSACERA